MADTEQLAETRSAFVSMMQSRFNPTFFELDSIYDSNDYTQARTQLSNWLEESSICEDGSFDDLGSELADALRIVATGRARLGQLFDSHRFDDAVSATTDGIDDAQLAEVIRDWNPPSVKTATRFSNDFANVAALANDIKSKASKSDSELEDIDAEFVRALDSVSDRADYTSGLIMELVAHREPLRQNKRNFISEAKKLGLISKAVGADKKQAANDPRVSKIQEQAAEAARLATNTQIENVKFVSKKKLHQVQKDWNKSQRNLREALFATQDEATKLNDITSGDFEPAELNASLNNHFGAKVSETREAFNEIDSMRSDLLNNEMIASEDQIRALDAVSGELRAYEEIHDAIAEANNSMLSER